MQTVEESSRIGITPEQKAKKRIRHKELVLAALIEAGPRGCTSEELNKICLRYGGRIFDLRKDGWTIKTHGRTGTELARYVFEGKACDENGQVQLL